MVKRDAAANPKPKRSLKRRLLRWTLVLLVLALVGSTASVEVTSQSWFCGSCHIMDTYYASWQVGPHKDVACVECHIAPGSTNFVSAKLNGLGQVVDDWLSRTSTKPAASVSQFSCLRSGCHVLESLSVPTKHELPFLYDHQKHLNKTYLGVTIQCTTCHSHFEGSEHFAVNTNVCITCHLHELAPSVKTDRIALNTSHTTEPQPRPAPADDTADGALVAPRSCQSCHVPPSKPFMYQGMRVDHNEFLSFGANCESCHRNVTAPAAAIRNEQCIACHDFGLEKLSDMRELHRIHSAGDHKVECFSCHGMIAHGPSAAIMSLNQFDCRGCHTNQHDLQRAAYLSTSNDDTQGEPLINPMFLAHVDCNGCHIKPRTLGIREGSMATVKIAVPEACDACHQPGFGKMMIDLWQSTTHKLFDETWQLLPTDAHPWANDAQQKQAIEHARQLLDQVSQDGSWGVHNPKYTQHLIEQARALLVDAGAIPLETGEKSP